MYVTRPKTTEKLWPRGDVDNYAKAIWDSLNTIAWEDDVQICDAVIHKRWAKSGVEGFYKFRVRKMDESEL